MARLAPLHLIQTGRGELLRLASRPGSTWEGFALSPAGSASKPHSYSSDSYFEHGRAKSVLCLPLLRQEEFVGVLYLENSLAADAFTPARIVLLGHIASQAAISIENARLYADIKQAQAALRDANDELERRVDERTHELKEAQARLVGMARAAGMSEIASNVLHNVGNILTSAVVSLETTRHEVGASRVVRVRQVAALLEEHRETLMDFLTKDPRGSRLPDYLSALAAELIHGVRSGTVRRRHPAHPVHLAPAPRHHPHPRVRPPAPNVA